MASESPPGPEQRLAALARLPHFAGLERGLVERVAACTRPRTLRAGEAVFQAGEACEGFFVVLAGAVKLYRLSPEGREQVVHRVGPGRSFAEAALFNIGRYPVHAAAAATPTELLLVEGTSFLALFRGEPRLAQGMVGSLCQRLLTLVGRVEELSLTSAAARLAHHLLRLPARGSGERLAVELAGPKKDLAAELSMTPETLSRLLRRFTERGLLEGRGRRLVLRDPDALTAIAEGAETPPA